MCSKSSRQQGLAVKWLASVARLTGTSAARELRQLLSNDTDHVAGAGGEACTTRAAAVICASRAAAAAVRTSAVAATAAAACRRCWVDGPSKLVGLKGAVKKQSPHCAACCGACMPFQAGPRQQIAAAQGSRYSISWAQSNHAPHTYRSVDTAGVTTLSAGRRCSSRGTDSSHVR